MDSTNGLKSSWLTLTTLLSKLTRTSTGFALQNRKAVPTVDSQLLEKQDVDLNGKAKALRRSDLQSVLTTVKESKLSKPKYSRTRGDIYLPIFLNFFNKDPFISSADFVL